MPDEKPDSPAFSTQAQALGMKPPEPPPNPHLSFSHGLERIEGSFVPNPPAGTEVQHVMGPQQSAVDPNAAGIDPDYNAPTIHDVLAITDPRKPLEKPVDTTDKQPMPPTMPTAKPAAKSGPPATDERKDSK